MEKEGQQSQAKGWMQACAYKILLRVSGVIAMHPLPHSRLTVVALVQRRLPQKALVADGWQSCTSSH